jgi:exodeoxyribonuclease VII small subunit
MPAPDTPHKPGTADDMDFEQSFARLQEVVRTLSEGSLTLQEALAAFEEGMALADRCSRMLDEAELRVRQVSERAMSAGAAALAELEASVRDSVDQPGRQAGPSVVSFQETYETETTIFFEGVGQGGSAGARGTPTPAPADATGAVNNARDSRSARPTSEELDPLFDDEE